MNRLKRSFSLLLSFLLLFSLCSCRDKAPDPYEQTIYYPLVSEPKSLDPQIAFDEPARLVIGNLFEGLCRLDEAGNAVPGVAKRWEANEDFTRFTFYLREDASWSNGTPVTADDFLFGFLRALSPQTGSSTCAPLFCIRGAEKVHSGYFPEKALGVSTQGDFVLVIELAYSFENFPRLTALLPAMPCNREFFEETGGKYGLEADCILSNGAFRVQKYGWEHGGYLRLSRNGFYSGELSPIPAGVSFTIGAPPPDAVNFVLSGAADALPISGRELSRAKEEGLPLFSSRDTVWGLCFNLSDPVFQSLEIRKSFVQSLDRAYLLSSLPEALEPGDSLLLPDMTVNGEAYRPLAGGPFYLPESPEVPALLASGLNELGRSALPGISILCLDDPDLRIMVNNLIETWNKRLGTYLNLKPLSRAELERAMQSGSYQLALAPIHAESENVLDLLSLFDSQNPLNPAQMKSGTYNNLLGLASGNPENALDLCVSMEKYLNEQAVFYPLCYENRYFVTSAEVSGLLFRPYKGGVDFSQAIKLPLE